LIAEVADSAKSKERFSLRCVAAYALGKLGVTSAEVVEVLAHVAGASGEAQRLRSYCIEALMDLGPSAAAAIPVLEQILKNEGENEDLRNFVWSALKSVGAGSREHPCGGTWAEPMRSLYRAE
jgi:Holliday junction resolvasome RuvABC DNA-binding subunit